MWARTRPPRSVLIAARAGAKELGPKPPANARFSQSRSDVYRGVPRCDRKPCSGPEARVHDGFYKIGTPVLDLPYGSQVTIERRQRPLLEPARGPVRELPCTQVGGPSASHTLENCTLVRVSFPLSAQGQHFQSLALAKLPRCILTEVPFLGPELPARIPGFAKRLPSLLGETHCPKLG
jgi:hypothetical protein